MGRNLKLIEFGNKDEAKITSCTVYSPSMKVAFCLVAVGVFPITDAAPEPLHIKNQWNTGLDAYFLVPPSLVGHGWTATITCDRTVDQFQVIVNSIFKFNHGPCIKYQYN